MGDFRREVLLNNVVTTLNGAINASTTSVTVADGSGFPAKMDCRIICEDEIMKVTDVSTNTLTVVRGVEGTTAATHADGTDVAAIATAQGLTNIFDQAQDFKPSDMHPAKLLDASGNVIDSTDFTWYQQGTSTITDESNGNLTLVVPGNSNADQWRGMELNPGSTPWTIEMFAHLNFGYLSGSTGILWGMYVRETSSSKLISLHNRQFALSGCADWTNATTFSAGNSSFENAYDRAWFKISDDGTNLTFSMSVDGRDYFQTFQEARGTFFTTGPDRVGFGINPFNADGPDDQSIMHIISWIQS